jgi:hypothetical protein
MGNDPTMLPTASDDALASAPSTNTSQPQPAGFWGTLAKYIQVIAPMVQSAGAHLAAAYHNYGPLMEMQQENELAMRRSMLQSQLQSAAQQRQLEQLNIDNYQTPAQRQQMALDTFQKQQELERQYAPPQDVIGPDASGQLAHYSRQYNPTTKQYETTPTMVSSDEVVSSPDNPVVPYDPSQIITRQTQRQLLAMPKSSGAPQVEPTKIGSQTGYDHVWYNGLGQEMGRSANALPNPAFVPQQTSTQGGSWKLDNNNEWVWLPSQSSTSKRAVLGGGQGSTPSAPSGGGGPKPGQVATDAQGNPLQGPATASTRTMREAAPHVLDFVNRITPLVQANQNNMGPIAGRWSDFWNGKVGAPDPSYNRLRVDDGLLTSLLQKMHVGSKGSDQMMQHFKDLLGLAHESPENYMAALDEIRQYATNIIGGQSGGAPNDPLNIRPPKAR